MSNFRATQTMLNLMLHLGQFNAKYWAVNQAATCSSADDVITSNYYCKHSNTKK